MSHAEKVAVVAGLASYLDAGALVTTGLVVSTHYADGFGLGTRAVGALLGLQTLAFAAGALYGGRLGDRYGRRRVFTLSLVVYALGVGLLGAAPDADWLLPGVIALGLAIGADLPASLALIDEEAPQGRKGRLVACSQLLWVAGIVASAGLAAVLADLGVLAGRLLFLHLLVVAGLVLALRLTLGESAEWVVARRAADSAGEHAPVASGSARQLLAPPVLRAMVATGGYYAAWNLGASTLGSYGPYLWVSLADGDLGTASLVSLAGLPLSALGTLAFLAVVDTPARHRWVVAGAVLTTTAWAVPLVLGPTRPALLALSVLFPLGAAVSGETIYKVWSQELYPTLLRSTAQGVTMAFARVVAGLFAFVTPSLARSSPDLLFGLLLALTAVAAVISVRWVPRLRPAGAPPMSPSGS